LGWAGIGRVVFGRDVSKTYIEVGVPENGWDGGQSTWRSHVWGVNWRKVGGGLVFWWCVGVG
jgi:hypothetical protein